MTWKLFLIPIASAFSCWLVIKLLFTILFRPHQPVSFFGLSIQGILPKQQTAIAAHVGRMAAEQFLSGNIIEQKISDPATLQKLMPLIEEHIDDFLRNKLKKDMPFVGMLIGDKTISSLKKVFMTELETLFPNIMRNYASNLIADLNIEQLVGQKLAALSIREIENSFRKNFSTEVRRVELASASIGLFIGLITMLVIVYLK
jgi:uncharacterized membrane protein YheB (UPF0754 family)